ncbi:MAG: M20/M25/M40 family metallo-hydrolase, partial [Pseudidiomarina maritima]|nr:M20/M25/M40 family metallo-hydrolase [Pseudidiomarina maritima]
MRMSMLNKAVIATTLATSCWAISPTQAAEPVQISSSLEQQVIEWRRDLHQHPELSNREFRTAKVITEHLQSLGLEVQTGVAHTGVVALLKGAKPGPTIALRADMDALPVVEQTDVAFKSTAIAEYRGKEVGVMHACGHDLHVAMLMG